MVTDRTGVLIWKSLLLNLKEEIKDSFFINIELLLKRVSNFQNGKRYEKSFFIKTKTSKKIGFRSKTKNWTRIRFLFQNRKLKNRFSFQNGKLTSSFFVSKRKTKKSFFFPKWKTEIICFSLQTKYWKKYFFYPSQKTSRIFFSFQYGKI